MKPIPDLDAVLAHAAERHIFGTKMRSVIKAANSAGIQKITAQQFEIGRCIAKAGMVPIIEPEVDIHIPDKAEAEAILLSELRSQLTDMPEDSRIIFKLTIPATDGFYTELMQDVRVVRVVALSGGYDRATANSLLSRNPGLVASFSRALTEGLLAGQSQAEFDKTLLQSITEIYKASIS